jgi:competence protein ComGC
MAVKKQDDILKNLPASAADFIKVVIRNMRYRKAVQRDVKNELAAHFEDELKDCKDDKEKEQKAKQIIEDFGDPKLLGVLLRRAKKRCRPLWRTAIVRSLQAAGLLILFLIIYTIWFLTGKPVITTDYVAEFNRRVRPVADESQNANPLYEKAIQLLKANSDYNDIKPVFNIKYEDANSVEKGKIEKFITANKGAFDLVIAGSQKPYYWRTYKGKNPNSGMIGILIPGLVDFRELAKLLVWRAQLSAEKGRFQDAFKDLTVCYHFGRHLRQGDFFLIEQLVGIAIETLSVQNSRRILDAQKIDSVVLAALQQDMERAISNENFTVNFTAEKLFMYDEIQRDFTGGSRGSHIIVWRLIQLSKGISGIGGSSSVPVFDVNSVSLPEKDRFSEVIDALWNITHDIGNMVYEGGVFAKRMGYVFFLHSNKKETRQQVDKFYDYVEKAALKSPAQARAEGINFEEAEKLVKGNILLEVLTPALGRVIEQGNRIKIDVQATVAIIALQRYKLDKGQYPESLDELVSNGYLKSKPIDSWSDKPLVYRKTEAGFTLYSIGKNFVDDGGKMGVDNKGRPRLWQDNGDWVFWPVVK